MSALEGQPTTDHRLQPELPPEAPARSPRSWRRVLVIVLPVVILLGTIIAAAVIIRGRLAVAPPVLTAEKAATALEAALRECAGEPACVLTTTQRFAALYQVADLCGKIDDVSGRDGCFLEVALRQVETEICGKIEDGGRAVACRDQVLFKRGRVSGDITSCGRIAAAGLVEACVNAIIGGRSDRALCNGLSDRAHGFCLAAVISNEAREKRDPAICEEISDPPLRSICSGGGDGFAPPAAASSEAPKPDADNDGLSDNEETGLGTDPANPDTDNDSLSDSEEVQKYKTDPLNPDTDADGFDDGTEVGGGYNPLGEGRL